MDVHQDQGPARRADAAYSTRPSQKAGDNPAKVHLEPSTNHDLRRAVRSGLSRERIEEHVREAVLAHVMTGIQKTYDVHNYVDEKREALTLWGARLRSIVEPPSANVVDLECSEGANHAQRATLPLLLQRRSFRVPP